jgi:hypothetical protein
MPRKAVSSTRAYPSLLALGSWRNEETFWKALVERKRLPHLGHPFGHSPVRDRLALGPVVFAGAPDAGDDLVAYLAFIEGRTKEYLKGNHLRRISFDITGVARLTGRLGDGFFVVRELAFVLAEDDLFRKTSWYQDGRYLRMARGPLRNYLQSLRPS